MLWCIILFFGSCKPMHPYSKVAPGIWRATLTLNPDLIAIPRPSDKQIVDRNVHFETNQDGILPFNFEIGYKGDSLLFTIFNGEERIVLDEIQFGRDRKTGNDTIIIRFPAYENYLTAIVKENAMSGYFVNPNKANYKIPFKAIFGQGYRFEPEQFGIEPFNFQGRWMVSFDTDTPKPYPAIGEFKQNGQKLQGTFRTESGDFRYLEGAALRDQMYLSCFDGSHAMLFRAKVIDGGLSGSVWYGFDSKNTWAGAQDDKNDLRDASSITTIAKMHYTSTRKYPTTLGLDKSITDPSIANKVRVITLSGTWCPNCLDEIRFLKAYQEKNPTLDFEVLPFYFEKHKDPVQNIEVLKRYKNRLKLPYTLYLGGYANKDSASATFPEISGVTAFPTMIILDKQSNIVKVHTGFDGPATSKFGAFAKEFGALMDKIK